MLVRQGRQAASPSPSRRLRRSQRQARLRKIHARHCRSAKHRWHVVLTQIRRFGMNLQAVVVPLALTDLFPYKQDRRGWQRQADYISFAPHAWASIVQGSRPVAMDAGFHHAHPWLVIVYRHRHHIKHQSLKRFSDSCTATPVSVLPDKFLDFVPISTAYRAPRCAT